MSETQEAPPTVTVSGDAEHGWIVDVHDGDKHGVYYPKGKDAEEAEENALKAHGYKKPASPATPMPPVGAKKEEEPKAEFSYKAETKAPTKNDPDDAKTAPKSDAPVHSTTHSTTVTDNKGKK